MPNHKNVTWDLASLSTSFTDKDALANVKNSSAESGQSMIPLTMDSQLGHDDSLVYLPFFCQGIHQ